MVDHPCARAGISEWERGIPIRALDEEMAAFMEVEAQLGMVNTGKAGLSGDMAHVVG